MFFLNNLIKINASLLTLFLIIAGLISYRINTEKLPVMNNTAGIEMPVIMYHSVLKDTNLSGKYVITPVQLDDDLKHIENLGYTTVSMDTVISYVKNGTPIPEKPILLTFDDGCYNNYIYALEIIEAHNAHAVFCIVGEYTDQYTQSDVANLTYGYMRWQDINELIKNPHAEVANHSYGFHSHSNGRNGSKRNSGEDSNEYREIFRKDTEKAQNCFISNTGFAPYIYAYPFGAYSPESFDILKEMGFEATLSCNEGINVLTNNSECLYLLKRYNRPSGISSADFFAKIEAAE